jgi:uncharacterized protein YheU (UPF0270 family)
MSVHKIPVDKLSPEALQGIIEEFISRKGTDYGAIEAFPETSFQQVKYKLETGAAVLIFDDETETTHIFLANDPVLKMEKVNDIIRNAQDTTIGFKHSWQGPSRSPLRCERRNAR